MKASNTTTINTRHADLVIRVLETGAFTSKTNPSAFFAYLRCTMPDASKYIARAFGTEDRGEFYLDLYAAGEILGSGQLQGNAFVGGMMAMPALVYGRLLGERLIPA